MKMILKRAASLSLCFVLCFLLVGGVSAQAAGWPTTSNIKTYPISTSNNITVYQTATSTARYGTIYASDLVTILGISGNRIKVSYPISGGSKVGYVDKSAITPGTLNVATSSFQATGTITAYRRSTGSLTIGSITRGDKVYIIATSGSRTQVIYPLTSGGGYKMGWINASSIPTSTANPIGCVDSAVSNANNQVTVSGWVAFPAGTSGSSQSLSCHVYVGGPAGSGAPGYAINANQYRADVNKAMGISGNHGFSTTITVDSSKTGAQTIYFYGIGGSNPLIGTKTVTIKGNSSSTFDPIWPCASAYKITCLYYYKDGSKHSTKYGYTNGMDIGGGGDIVAVESGVVETKDDLGSRSFGKYIIIRHPNGTRSLYAHLSSFNVVQGQSVSKGQKIGVMGNTGNSGGTHLHFELSNTDPWNTYYKSKYRYQLTYDSNVRSNNWKYNGNQTIVRWLDDNYKLSNGVYVPK